jgi:hypothetical protein
VVARTVLTAGDRGAQSHQRPLPKGASVEAGQGLKSRQGVLKVCSR